MFTILPSGLRSLSVHMSCSSSVVAYFGSRENASMWNVFRGSWVRMLHVDFVSLMRSLFNVMVFGIEKRAAYSIIRPMIVLRVFYSFVVTMRCLVYLLFLQ